MLRQKKPAKKKSLTNPLTIVEIEDHSSPIQGCMVVLSSCILIDLTARYIHFEIPIQKKNGARKERKTVKVEPFPHETTEYVRLQRSEGGYPPRSWRWPATCFNGRQICLIC